MSAAGSTGFIDYLVEVFESFGPIYAKRMFGGYGIYHDELMFGLVSNDVLYLKADEASLERFLELGLTPFEYTKKGRLMRISYYTAPESVFDDPDEARNWATLAYAAALRSRTKQ
jgi:DNA transformation protein and related proteins